MASADAGGKAGAVSSSEQEEDAIDDPAGQVLQDLPLWRIPLAALPGTQVRLQPFAASTASTPDSDV